LPLVKRFELLIRK